MELLKHEEELTLSTRKQMAAEFCSLCNSYLKFLLYSTSMNAFSLSVFLLVSAFPPALSLLILTFKSQGKWLKGLFNENRTSCRYNSCSATHKTASQPATWLHFCCFAPSICDQDCMKYSNLTLTCVIYRLFQWAICIWEKLCGHLFNLNI